MPTQALGRGSRGIIPSSPKARRTILITGANFLNQGAFLMLMAASRAIRERFDAQPVIEIRHGSQRDRVRYGLDTLLGLQKIRFRPWGPSRAVMRTARDALPFVVGSDIDAVFDASGFAFGDQWAAANLVRRAGYFAYWQRHGVPVYLLPQAFGPLERTAAAASIVLSSSQMVFARDDDSRRHLEGLRVGGASATILQSPDFTVGLEAVEPSDQRLLALAGSVPIIPNWNIVERASSKQGAERYMSALEEYARAIRDRGLDVYGLCHEGERDRLILEELARRVPGLQVVKPADGLQAKWLLGNSPMVVAGRFHAIVSALSQGVPSVIHGWSHKYKWLAEDFSAGSLLRDPYQERDQRQTVDMALDDKSLRSAISEASFARKRDVESMWMRIDDDLRPRLGW